MKKRLVQLPPFNYKGILNDFFYRYYKSMDHPFKLRILRWVERICGEKRIKINTSSGFKLGVDKADLIQRTLLYQGVWEKKLTTYLSTILNEKDVLFDIGANIGYFSCLALHKNISHVVCFDPDPINTTMIKYNFDLNKFDSNHYHIIQKGLSDVSSNMTFFRSRVDNTGLSGFTDVYATSVSKFSVDVKRLDEIIVEKNLPYPTILKIDTEAFEEKIIKGATNLLTQKPPRIIVFEAYSNESKEQILTHIKKYGYLYESTLEDQHGMNHIAVYS